MERVSKQKLRRPVGKRRLAWQIPAALGGDEASVTTTKVNVE
jgi:hypothetical protein